MTKKKEHIDNQKVKEGLKDISKKSHGFINEFKTFIARGNVMDLAVGVIIGNAFSKIVTSLTDNILMPLVGIVIGGFDFTNLSYTCTLWTRTVELKYGIFIQNTVDFLLTAFCIFIVIKAMNKIFTKKEEMKKEEPKEPPKKSDETILLEEIRDLLKEQKRELDN